MHVTGVILAGGKSRRMGRDKAFLPFGKGVLIERVIEVLRQVTDELLLITNTPEKYEGFGLPMASDVIPEAGSLGGIYTGLVYTQRPYSLCLAYDMPFVKPEFLRFLCEEAVEADVVIPRNAEDFQPLCAVYSLPVASPFASASRAVGSRSRGFSTRCAYAPSKASCWRAVFLGKLIGWKNRIRVALDWIVGSFFDRDISKLEW